MPPTAEEIVAAVALYAEDAVPCDANECRDGTGPVCDVHTLGCVLRRILLRPAEVHALMTRGEEPL